LANVLRTSTNPQFALFMELTSNALASCDDGSFAAMDYVVGCHGGCTQPVATFTSECISANQYNVTVTISEIGSAGSATITNDGGAATVAATAAGTYTVGPFASQATVHIEVEGANALCSWTSPAQSRDCTGVGISEQQSNVLSLYPNPSEGQFRLDLPSSLDGTTDMRVLDLQGRVLVQRGAIQAEGPTMVLDLSGFPNGTYIVMLHSERSVYTGKVQVVH
jgi:hypothetical protein